MWSFAVFKHPKQQIQQRIFELYTRNEIT